MTFYRNGTTGNYAGGFTTGTTQATHSSTQTGDLVLVWVSVLCYSGWDYGAQGCPVITSGHGDLYHQVGGTSAYSSNVCTNNSWWFETAAYWAVAGSSGADTLTITMTASWGGSGDYYN